MIAANADQMAGVHSRNIVASIASLFPWTQLLYLAPRLRAQVDFYRTGVPRTGGIRGLQCKNAAMAVRAMGE